MYHGEVSFVFFVSAVTGIRDWLPGLPVLTFAFFQSTGRKHGPCRNQGCRNSENVDPVRSLRGDQYEDETARLFR